MDAALKGKMIIFSAVCLHNLMVLIYIIAHKVTHNSVGILHQDISPGNILIFSADELCNSKDPHNSTINGGMLIDWDLSKPFGSGEQGGTCQHAHMVS